MSIRTIAKPRDLGGIIPTFAEQHPLLEQAKEYPLLEKALLLGLHFGMRKGEILALEWGDLDFAECQAAVYKSLVCAQGGAYLNPPKSPASVRTIPMTSYAAERLGALREPSGRIVPANPQTVSAHLRDWMGAHKDVPQVTLFSCRHSFATACVMADIPLEHVSVWLGHSSMRVTRRAYAKLQLLRLHGEAAKIDAAFEKTQKPY